MPPCENFVDARRSLPSLGMRAVTFQAPGDVQVQERSDPRLEARDDAIGLDHVLSVLDGLLEERGEERYRAAPLLRSLVWSGRLGKQTGEGFFTHA